MKSITRNIAVFGGSFNPPTLRHREIGLLLLAHLPLDQVWYLVAPLNPFKTAKNMASFQDRLAMMRLALAQTTGLIVSDAEGRFAQQCGVGAMNSSDTLRLLRLENPWARLVWVVGCDNFVSMHTWDGYKDIIAHHPVVVTPRVGFMEDVLGCPVARELTQIKDPQNVLTSTGWYLLDVVPNGISATECRESLRKNQIPSVMDPNVARFALERRLYATSAKAAAL